MWTVRVQYGRRVAFLREHSILVSAVEDSSRQRQLQQWLVRQLGKAPPGGLEPASADASFRRYYRLYPQRDGLANAGDSPTPTPWTPEAAPASVILMDAPPPQEDLARFVRLAEQLRAVGLNTPHVWRADLEAGIALVADFGTTPYAQAMAQAPETADALYYAAVDALVRLQVNGQRSTLRASLPAYDEALLRRELALLHEWYLERHLGLDVKPHEGLLRRAGDLLVGHALKQPSVPVHRDYHSRNLMLVTEKTLPGVLDFQDAVLGAQAYDLASLLRDCYVVLDDSLQQACLQRYLLGVREAAADLPGFPVPSFDELEVHVDLAAIQRHLKVLGIFTRLWYRDRRPDYLQYLPRVRAYLASACARHEPLRALGDWLGSLAEADAGAVASIQAAQEVS